MLFHLFAISFSSSWLYIDKSVDFGKSFLTIPFEFSFNPLCPGEPASAKYTFNPSFLSSISNHFENSFPVSKVIVFIGFNSILSNH